MKPCGKKGSRTKFLSSDLSFREKIAKYIDVFVDHGLAYSTRQLPRKRMARHPEKVKVFCTKDPFRSSDLIRTQLEREVKKGKLGSIQPNNLW